MAGAGYKLFAAGDVLSASDVNTYMMQQTVMVFANSTARTTALSSVLAEGMVSYLQDTNSLEVYDGSAWVGATGDITGLTAGTGVSITSATGPVPTVAIDTAVVPRLGVANTFTTSPQQINGAASAVSLIIRGNATTPGNLQEWQDSAGNIYSLVGSSGRFGIRTQSLTGSLNVSTQSAGNVGVIISAVASQTADLTSWRDSSGNGLSSIDAFGRLRIRTTTTSAFSAAITAASAATVGLMVQGAASQTANLQEWQDSSGTIRAAIESSGFIVAGSSTSISNATISARPYGASQVGIAVRGAASQTANLQEWQNSAGTVLSWIASDGTPVTATSTGLKVGGTGITGHFTVRTPSASTIAAVIRGAASQTANLTEWQDSASTVMAAITPAGRLYVTRTEGIQFIAGSGTVRSRIYSDAVNDVYISGSNGGLTKFGTAGGITVVSDGNTSVVKLVVQGSASQTANLTEWQDSTGTVLARITSAGAIVSASSVTATSFATSSTGIQAGVFNSGGYIRIEKATASATTGSTTAAQLFLLTGTNANTVKLVIRSNGAETTILDNIPTT